MADNLAGSGQDLDTSLPTIYGMFKTLRDYTPMLKRLATTVPLKAHAGASASIINYNRATGQRINEGADLTQSFVLADTLSTYSPQRFGVKAFLPRSTERRISDPQLASRLASILSDAYSWGEESALADEFVNFTTALGSAGDVLSPGHIAAGTERARLGNTRRQDSTGTRPEMPSTPISTVLHPFHALTVVGRMIPYTDVPTGTSVYGVNTGAHAGETVGVGNSSAGLDLLRAGTKAIDQINGQKVYVCPAINVDASDDASSATFAKEGLIWCPEREAEPWEEEDRSHDRREIGIDGWFATGVFRPSVTGIEYLADASMPTS